jgi:bifunctional oligoribonuclease and PAP phosphatase NrnA
VNNKSLLENSGILDFIRCYTTFYIVGHKEPDGDCIGSQLALGSFLERQGKKAVLLSSGPFTRTEIASWAPLFCAHMDHSVPLAESRAIIVMDCSSLSRIGSLVDELPADTPVAFIDHHASGASDGDVRYVDTSSPAVTCLVQRIMEASGSVPTRAEAEFLLFGLCTDTGFFRHLDERSSVVFEETARLVALGASPKHAFDMMNGGKPFASRKLLGEMLVRAETRFDGKLIISTMSLEDQAKYGLVSRDSDMLYQLLLTIAGMEVAVVVRQESPTECTVGFRSRESIDVSAIAGSFGGGGHRLAAGLHIVGQAQEVSERVIKAFESVFSTT